MADFAKRNLSAQKAVDRLFKLIFDDLDEVRGGIRWWHGHLDQARVIFASDYLVSLAGQAGGELRSAAFHEQQFTQSWNAEEIWLRTQQHNNVEHPFVNRNGLDQLREARITAAIEGFFYACGSALDKLAATAVAVLAIRTDLVKADWQNVAKCVNDPREAERRLAPAGGAARRLQDDIIAAIWTAGQSGPTDWLTWTLGYRNTLIHRAPRIPLRRILPRKRQDPLRYVMQLPRHPELTDAEALLIGSDSADLWLPEDAVVTVAGVLDHLGRLVEATAAGLAAAWEQRRSDPALLTLPDAQWSAVYPERRDLSRFAGFGQPLPDIAELTVNPRDGRRLLAAKVFDADRPEWARRMAGHANGVRPGSRRRV